MVSLPSRVRLWIYNRLPVGILARPAEWFIAFLCVIAGIPITIGVIDTGSIEALLPLLFYKLWGACLVVGGIGMATGLSSIREVDNHYVVTRIPVYKLGLRLLALASVVYAIAIIAVAGMAGAYAAGLNLVFALMCAVRLITLGGR